MGQSDLTAIYQGPVVSSCKTTNEQSDIHCNIHFFFLMSLGFKMYVTTRLKLEKDLGFGCYLMTMTLQQ
jgi:hypothetical protein